MTKYIEILTKACPLFAGFTAEETAAILTASHPRIQQLAKGEYLFHAGTKTDTAGIVLSGSVHIVRHDYQGSTVLLAELGPGNLFAESFSLANLPLTVSVTAGQDSAVLLLPVRSLTASSASAPARRLLNNMLQVFARKNVFLTERIEHLSQRTLREKLLSYLSNAAEKNGSDTVVIPLNRQELADYLAVDRSALSAVISALRSQGVIDAHKNRFTLYRHSSATHVSDTK